jgi:hypothetical protein
LRCIRRDALSALSHRQSIENFLMKERWNDRAVSWSAKEIKQPRSVRGMFVGEASRQDNRGIANKITQRRPSLMRSLTVSSPGEKWLLFAELPQAFSRFSRIVLWCSAALYLVGVFSAFLLGPLLIHFDQ